MRTLLILSLIFLFSVLNFEVKAQACGYTFITIYLSDNSGRQIKNARFTFFDKKYESKGLHNNNLITWNEERFAYFGVEGMCGGHNNVEITIEAEGFENLKKQIDLPLGWESFSVKLKRLGTNEQSSFEPLAHFRGKVSDENGSGLSDVQINLTDKTGTRFQTVTNYGRFGIDVPLGVYKIEFIPAKNFIQTILEQKELSNRSNFVDVVVKEKNNKEERP